MKTYKFKVLIISLAISLSCPAQKNEAQNHIQQLSSPKMYGRGYVNNGIGIAANYIDSCFTSYQLQKFKKLNNYAQSIIYDVNTFPQKMELLLNDSSLIPGIDYIIEPHSKAINGSFNCITFTKKDFENIDNFKARIPECIGKIIVIDDRNLETIEAKKLQEINGILLYISTIDIGIVGIIEISNDKLTWSGSTFVGTIPYIKVNSSKTPSRIIKASVQIDQVLEKKYKSSNICGFIQGNSNSDSVIVLTAHYDHLGMMGNKTMFPGANDNASGVAMLLTLAKYFSKTPAKYTIVFVALTGEELGLLGSTEFVKNSPIELSKIKFLINFDLAGTGDEGIQIVNSTIYKKEIALLDSINTAQNLLSQIKKRGEACISDHCPFYQKGVPSIYIYTLGGIRAYHDVFDKVETLPLTEFDDYQTLMKKILEKL